MKKVIAWVKREPVLLTFIAVAGANLGDQLSQGHVTAAGIRAAAYAALGALVRQFTSPVSKG